MSSDFKGWGREVMGPKIGKMIDITAGGPKEQKVAPPMVGPALEASSKIKWGSKMDSRGDAIEQKGKLNLSTSRSDKIQKGPQI